MFDLSKSFSQLCLEIYGNNFSFSISTLKCFEKAKKSETKQIKFFPPFSAVENQTHFFLLRNTNFKIVFLYFFVTEIMLTTLIEILKICRIILPFFNTHFLPPKNLHKTMHYLDVQACHFFNMHNRNSIKIYILI